ncbi:hypothetical protein [Cecembia rubra]|uniref:Seryl-tRNA synthetase n=1 Tax=Cecembia rubra TaxID=1485585 RepID=A0A2P8DTH9_9BACT|nr:hypothetical protein [Cecembia rubra]PSL00511.1 hypothetical protein CLV48_11563 [Cecembia rubra]
MKKIMWFLSVTLLLTVFSPVAMAKKDKPELTEEQKERLKEIELRVEEIKAMDFTDLDKSERKEVREELKEMKKEAKELGGGIYLSVGAIIIILLILILLT